MAHIRYIYGMYGIYMIIVGTYHGYHFLERGSNASVDGRAPPLRRALRSGIHICHIYTIYMPYICHAYGAYMAYIRYKCGIYIWSLWYIYADHPYVPLIAFPGA